MLGALVSYLAARVARTATPLTEGVNSDGLLIDDQGYLMTRLGASAGTSTIGKVGIQVGAADVSLTNPVPTVGATLSQSAAGPIVAAQKFTLKNAAGRLASLKVQYKGTGVSYLQLHDVVSGGTLSDATMLEGGGIPVDDVTQLILLRDWPYPLKFDAGITVALSSTPNTYTASAQTMIASGQWS